MKFAHEFQESLERGEYPVEWIESAIPYRKLKKCIRKVQEELMNLGLDPNKLEQLWQRGTPIDDDGDGSGGGTIEVKKSSPVRYSLTAAGPGEFVPKLTLVLDPLDCSPNDAWLSQETSSYLHRLAKTQKVDSSGASLSDLIQSKQDANTYEESADQPCNPDPKERSIEGKIIEVPLTSDSEFFQLLNREITSLEHLHEEQEKALVGQIVKLGHELSIMRASSSKKAKANVKAWREILRLYIDSQIFFSSHEQDAGARDVQHAQQQLQSFQATLMEQLSKGIKLEGTAKVALDRFIHINVNLLRFMQFQDLNRTAVSKIMKKFDKRTALHAQASVARSLAQGPFMAQDLAKATCFTISEEVLTLIPQLEDYLCPICFSITYKPVRLRCEHVFCIRCLVVMQRDGKDHCPLCREAVVLEASSDNLDKQLMTFLKANFPKEVKAKQKANEIAAGVDRFGEGFEATHSCTLM